MCGAFTAQDNLVELAEALQVLYGSAVSQYYIPSVKLNWCTCIFVLDRMEFVKNVVEAINAKLPKGMFNEQRPLVYTSLASGGLLQDFKIIQALLDCGYKDIIVNVIDFLYSYDNKFFFHSTAGWQIYKYGNNVRIAANMYEYVKGMSKISVSQLISKLNHSAGSVLYSYPYTALQDLVDQAASPNTLVFRLNKNPVTNQPEQRIAQSADDFLKEDVISPYIKKYIDSGYELYARFVF